MPVPPNATRSALVRFSVFMVDEALTAREVVVAPAAVKPPLKAICVEVALPGNGYPIVLVITPVEELYEIPLPPESEVEDILLLKKFQSVEERYPLLPLPACEIESVEPEKLSGAETVVESSAEASAGSERPPLAFTIPPTLRTFEIVVDPSTANAEDVAEIKSAAAKWLVEEAKMPFCNHRDDEVAATTPP